MSKNKECKDLRADKGQIASMQWANMLENPSVKLFKSLTMATSDNRMTDAQENQPDADSLNTGKKEAEKSQF
jgi:hypothetical protein